MGESIFYLIMIVICFILLGMAFFCFKMAIVTSKSKKARKQIQQNRINDLNSLLDGEFFHVMGLSLPENTYCHVYLCDDKVVIDGNGVSFNLLKHKILDINLKTDKEIEKAYVSSAGGAVGGALLFGPLGALVGGRVKEKKSTKITQYLIFTYDKDGKPDYIAFNVGINSLKAIKFMNYFRENYTGNKIEVNL